jgi:hypothetical protein
LNSLSTKGIITTLHVKPFVKCNFNVLYINFKHVVDQSHGLAHHLDRL